MVQCFAPDCNHRSERETCRFFRFPAEKKNKALLQKWIALISRQDKEPQRHSRICSCHFRDGKKENRPEIFNRNKDTIFPKEQPTIQLRKKSEDANLPENKDAQLSPKPIDIRYVE